jgi:hypothetical protein
MLKWTNISEVRTASIIKAIIITTLMMEVVCTSETSVHFVTTWRYIPITRGKYNRPKAAALRWQSYPITTTNLQSTLQPSLSTYFTNHHHNPTELQSYTAITISSHIFYNKIIHFWEYKLNYSITWINSV